MAAILKRAMSSFEVAASVLKVAPIHARQMHHQHICDRYERAHRRSIEDPNGFWSDAAEAIEWFKKPSVILDRADPAHPKWFSDGTLNTAHNCLDRHVAAGRGDHVALIYHSAMTGARETYTYKDMTERVAKAAGMLLANGVERGDRVIVYMPMIPEAMISMLACARIGAIHSVVVGGFGAAELATRIDHAQPKLILAGSCGIEPKMTVDYQSLVNSALDIAQHKPKKVIYKQRDACRASLQPGRDLDWDEEIDRAKRTDCVEVGVNDPLYILYTSGTTGAPKGVVRDNVGHAVAMHWVHKNVFDFRAGDTIFTASDLGWMVGHSNMTYGPLISGSATVLYEGKPVGTPDAAEWWRIVEAYGVRTLLTAPTAIRAIGREDPEGVLMEKYNVSTLERVFCAGEHLDPATEHYVENHLRLPLIDNYWQSEAGWAMISNPVGLQNFQIKYGSACKPIPGWDIHVLNSEGKEAGPFDRGELAVKLPLPPGALTGLYGSEEKYRGTYLTRFPGYYSTSDAGYRDEQGYFYVMARTDDVINVAGHRLSTGAIEEVLNSHPSVGESAVFGMKDTHKGEVPVGMVVLKNSAAVSDALAIERECVRLVRERIGPVAFFKTCRVIAALPKTRSGKILRGTMKKLADGEQVNVPPTIDDPQLLDKLAQTFKGMSIDAPL